MKRNPLEIPEVIALVIRYVPLWTPPSMSRPSLRFKPKDVLSCSAVNSTWRHASLSTLWFTYDESQKIVANIPSGVLRQNSRFFKIINLSMPQKTRIFEINIHLARPLSITMASDAFSYFFDFSITSSSTTATCLDIQSDNQDPMDPLQQDYVIQFVKTKPALKILTTKKYFFWQSDLTVMLQGKANLQHIRLINCSIFADEITPVQLPSLFTIQLHYCNISIISVVTLVSASPTIHHLTWYISKTNADRIDYLEMATPQEQSPISALTSLHLLMHFKRSMILFSSILKWQFLDTVHSFTLSLNNLQPQLLNTIISRRSYISHLSLIFKREFTDVQSVHLISKDMHKLLHLQLTFKENFDNIKHDKTKFVTIGHQKLPWTMDDNEKKSNLKDQPFQKRIGKCPSSFETSPGGQQFPLFDTTFLQCVDEKTTIQRFSINGRHYQRP